MKQNLENSIKSSLENFELPYDASAWSALSKKLDAVQPTSTPPKSNLGKWGVAAGAAVAISIATYFIASNNEEPQNTAQISQESNVENSPKTEETATIENKKEVTKDAAEKENSTISTDLNDSKHSSAENTSAGKETHSKTDGSSKGSESPFSPQTNDNTAVNGKTGGLGGSKPTPSVNYILPKIKDACQGESIALKNENSEELTLVTPSNKKFIVAKKGMLKLDVNEIGTYELAIGSQHSTFHVNSKPKLDFTIDEQTQFENGVPSTPLQTFSEGSNFVWTFDDSSVKLKGKSVDAHFFTKGTKTIHLSAEGEKGCVAKTSKEIEISSDYKLFAPTGFEPNHSDPRRKHFIPNALLVRDVQFTMIIVDPKTGATIFTTNNASNGWDGIDITTGEMVPENSTYVWKVFLANPLPGEKSEYSSTVVRR